MIKNFLLDNYIWIIVVIILIIITIVGFLADKKKSKDPKTSEATPTGASNPTSNEQNSAAPINYQPVQNNIPGVLPTAMQNNSVNLTNNQASPVTNTIPNQNVSAVIPNLNGQQVTPVSVEPINNNIGVNPEPMYQPLAEQKPAFTPVTNNVINAEQMPINNVVPTPIDNVNPVGQPINQVPNQLPVNNQITQVQIPTPTIPTPVQQPMPNPMINNANIPNINNNPIPSQEITQQPVTFVYGAQSNNQNNNGQM